VANGMTAVIAAACTESAPFLTAHSERRSVALKVSIG
jgi:hypothetical protein